MLRKFFKILNKPVKSMYALCIGFSWKLLTLINDQTKLIEPEKKIYSRVTYNRAEGDT